MIQPIEMKRALPMQVANGVMSTTTRVWDMLSASKEGDVQAVKRLVSECPELIYAQYNYTPPIHFAVREGHVELVKYLLGNGAYDPSYKTYPFLDSLLTIAQDREHHEIASLLQAYHNPKFKGDNGEIHYNRTASETEFEKAVDKADIALVEQILKLHPHYAQDETFFWSEGILLFPAKEYNRPLIDLLMLYGAQVPRVLKWAQFYYFERYDSAAYLLQHGMHPNTMSWHHVTLLHDMAQKGDLPKAELLVKHGADINAIEEEYQSTPLGMAVRWGHAAMVEYLLQHGADPNRSGAYWSTPLSWARKKGFTEIEKLLTNAISNHT